MTRSAHDEVTRLVDSWAVGEPQHLCARTGRETWEQAQRRLCTLAVAAAEQAGRLVRTRLGLSDQAMVCPDLQGRTWPPTALAALQCLAAGANHCPEHVADIATAHARAAGLDGLRGVVAALLLEQVHLRALVHTQEEGR